MKVLIANAPRLVFKGDMFFPTIPPLGAGFVYGYLKENKIDCDLIDLNIRLLSKPDSFMQFMQVDGGMGIDEFLKKHKELAQSVSSSIMPNLSQYSVFAVSIIESPSLKILIPMFQSIKASYPHIKIVVGGPTNPICMPYIESRLIDFIIDDNGEANLVTLIKALEAGSPLDSVPSMHYMCDGKHVLNRCIPFQYDSQVLDFPTREIEPYRFIQSRYDRSNDIFHSLIMPYSFVKGCTFNCTFCSAPVGHVKTKSPEIIVRDLKRLKERFKTNYFFFLNQHITVSRRFIYDLCKALIEADLGIYWCDCAKPLAYMDREIFQMLHKAGCIRLSFGIESGSEKILGLMNKGHTARDCEASLRYSHEAGIWNDINIMVGFPTETDADFLETKTLIRRNAQYIDSASACTFRLELMSQVYKNPEAFSIVLEKDSIFTRLCITPVIKYSEQGFGYEQLQQRDMQRMSSLSHLYHEFGCSIIENQLSKNSIFPLYELLRDKAIVKQFIKENAGLLKKIGTAEIFVGSASNQQMPEYRSLCEDYREIDYNAVIENIERELKDYYGIFISGGEPLIRKDIFSILEKARALGAKKLALKTNARMLASDDFCSRMADVVDEIMVFVPDDSVSQVKGSEEQSRKGIDNWRKAGKKAVSYSRIS